jgi:hypothetical protein
MNDLSESNVGQDSKPDEKRYAVLWRNPLVPDFIGQVGGALPLRNAQDILDQCVKKPGKIVYWMEEMR